MKILYKIEISFVPVVFALFLGACTVVAPILPEQLGTSTIPDDFLSELKQINDYPFYVAYYVGDYGFDAYLESGVYPLASQQIKYEQRYACSCFYASGDSPIFGRNFDWYEHPVLLLITDPPGGYRSVSMVDISYLGYDREFTPFDDPEGLRSAPFYPFDGMNEHGLAVGMMAVGQAAGVIDPDRPTLDSLEIMRLILDHARDLSEALDLLADYNVDFGSVPVHYLIADHSGNSVVVEYIDNELVVVGGKKPYQAATNFILSEVQLEDVESHDYRYNTLIRVLSKLEGRVEEDFAMDLLADVSQGGGETATRWSVVYDLDDLSVTAAINRDYRQLYNFTID